MSPEMPNPAPFCPLPTGPLSPPPPAIPFAKPSPRPSPAPLLQFPLGFIYAPLLLPLSLSHILFPIAWRRITSLTEKFPFTCVLAELAVWALDTPPPCPRRCSHFLGVDMPFFDTPPPRRPWFARPIPAALASARPGRLHYLIFPHCIDPRLPFCQGSLRSGETTPPRGPTAASPFRSPVCGADCPIYYSLSFVDVLSFPYLSAAAEFPAAFNHH